MDEERTLHSEQLELIQKGINQHWNSSKYKSVVWCDETSALWDKAEALTTKAKTK